jgi:hypothetical protein
MASLFFYVQNPTEGGETVTKAEGRRKRKREELKWVLLPIPRRCQGCPYPGTGFVCCGRDGSCMRTDVERIVLRQKREKRMGG